VVLSYVGGCLAGERYLLRLSVTQPGARAALARGGECGPVNLLWTRPWHLMLARGSRPLRPGPAQACAFEQASRHGQVRATGRTCVPIRLTAKGVARRPEARLSAGGLSLVVPAGWSGLAYAAPRRHLSVLRTASFALPPAGADDDVGEGAHRRMRPGDVLVNLLDEGRPDPRLGLTPARLPLRITRGDLGAFEGCRLGCALEQLRVSGRAFALWAVFGRAHPSASQLRLANRVLATLRVRPLR